MRLKVFGQQTMVYAYGLFALRFAGVLLIPLYTRTFSMTDYGLLLTLLVTVEILTIFMGCEIRCAFIRYYKDSESQGSLGRLWGTTTVLSVFGCIIVGALALIFLPPLFEKTQILSEPLPFIIAICFLALCDTIHKQTISYYRANNNAVKYSIFSGLSAFSILFFTLIILGPLNGGVIGALYARAISYGIFGSYMFFEISKRIKPSFSAAFALKLIRFGLPLVMAASAWFILEASDRYFLAHFTGLDVVGMYGLGYRVASILVFSVVMPFQLAYGPFTFSILDEPDAKDMVARLFFYLILCLLVGGLCLTIGSPILLWILAPPEYGQAYLVVLCILPAAAMIGVFYWGSALIHIAKKTHLIALITGGAALLNVLLNYLLIPHIGWLGAALATDVSIFFAAAGVCLFGMRLFPVPLRKQGRLFPASLLAILSQFIGKLRAKINFKKCKRTLER